MQYNSTSTSSSTSSTYLLKQQPCNRTQLRLVHSAISLFTLLGCFTVVKWFDALLLIGQSHTASSILLFTLGIVEIAKHYVNLYVFKLVAKMKKTSELPDRESPAKLKDPNYIRYVFQCICVILASIVIASAVCILFGAPLQKQFGQTLHLASLMVTISVFPLVLFIGPIGTIQYVFCDFFELATRNQSGYLKMIHYNAVCVFVGAWASSVVHPLDWDRPWQLYPLPNMCGALLGMVAGNLYAMGLSGYKKLLKPKLSNDVFADEEEDAEAS